MNVSPYVCVSISPSLLSSSRSTICFLDFAAHTDAFTNAICNHLSNALQIVPSRSAINRKAQHVHRSRMVVSAVSIRSMVLHVGVALQRFQWALSAPRQRQSETLLKVNGWVLQRAEWGRASGHCERKEWRTRESFQRAVDPYVR